MSAFVPFYDFAAVASISMSQSGDANDATRNSVEPVRRSSSRAFTVHSLKGAVNRVIIDRAHAATAAFHVFMVAGYTFTVTINSKRTGSNLPQNHARR